MWVILRTEPCRERIAAFFLEELHDFSVYLPLLGIASVKRGKVTVDVRPLFPSYLFAKHDGGSFRRYVTTPGVSSVVMAASCPAFVRQSSIDEIDARLSEWNADPQPFAPGQRVVTASGLEAIFAESNGRIRSRLMLSLFRREVVADVRTTTLRQA